MMGALQVIFRRYRLSTVAITVSSFFVLKLVLGVVLLVAAARMLPVTEFTIFSQLLVLLALLVTLATGGVQHGVIREVAAQQDSTNAEYSVIRAALTVWAVVGTVLVIAAFSFSRQISELLVGSPKVSSVVPWLAAAAVGTGLGMLLCAILTGQNRPVASMGAQAIGLTTASAFALVFLVRGQPIMAAAGFAAGPLLTTFLSMLWVGRHVIASLRLGTRPMANIRRLLGFSSAFLVTASVMPLTLIGLRSVYLESFGLELLGYWLTANRISDINTQLLGLYLTQEYLPKASSLTDPRARRVLLVRVFLLGSFAMLAAMIVFLIAPSFWISLFLSGKFGGAASFMRLYFLGDFLRVASALLAYTALANRQFVFYVFLEIFAAAIIAALVLSFTALGVASGPPIAYAVTYGLITLIWGLNMWRTGTSSAGDLTLGGSLSSSDAAPSARTFGEPR